MTAYKDALTSFGLARIYAGRPLEKCLWTTATILILIFCCYYMLENTVRFFDYNVKMETKSLEKVNGTLPVITLCLQSTLIENFGCYNNNSVYSNSTCNYRNVKGTKLQWGGTIESLKTCKKLEHDCHVFNEHGTITGYQKIHFTAPAKEYDTLVVFFQSEFEFQHRKEIVYLTSYERYMRLTHGTYSISVKEKQTTRKPHPYSTNCTDANKVPPSMFSDRYTQDSCREECAYNYMLEKCGDVVDFWKKFRVGNVKPVNSSEFKRRKECIGKVILEMSNIASHKCTCRNACKDTTYTITKQRRESYGDSNFYWSFAVSKEILVTKEDFVSDFPKFQYLSSIGGILGLGGKFQVVFQLFVFISICFRHLLARGFLYLAESVDRKRKVRVEESGKFSSDSYFPWV